MANTERLLDLFAEARRHGHVLRARLGRRAVPGRSCGRIARDGHEVASHGYWHRLVYDQTPDEFRDDLRRARDVLEDGGRRAGPRLSRAELFDHRALALGARRADRGRLRLRRQHLPDPPRSLRHSRRAAPAAPDHAQRPARCSKCPSTAGRIGSLARARSAAATSGCCPTGDALGHRADQRQGGQPAIFYIHPWEIDPDQPRLDAALPTPPAPLQQSRPDRGPPRGACCATSASDSIESVVLAARRDGRSGGVSAAADPPCSPIGDACVLADGAGTVRGGTWLVGRPRRGDHRACSSSGTTARCTRYGYWSRSSACSCVWSRRDALARHRPQPVAGRRRRAPRASGWCCWSRAASPAIVLARAGRAGRRRGGRRAARLRAGRRPRIVWAAVAYLLLMVPLWDGFTEPLHLALPEPVGQHRRARSSRPSASPRYRDGDFITLPTLTLEVARACSGVNYLVAVLALGLPLSYLYLRSPWRRVVLIVSAAGHRRAVEQPARRDHRRPRLPRRRRAAARARRTCCTGSSCRASATSRCSSAWRCSARRGAARPARRRRRRRPARPPRRCRAASARPSRWPPVFLATTALRGWRQPAPVALPPRSTACLPASARWTADPYTAPARLAWWPGADQELRRVYRHDDAAVDVHVGVLRLAAAVPGSRDLSRLASPSRRARRRCLARRRPAEPRQRRRRAASPARRRVTLFWYQIDGGVESAPLAVEAADAVARASAAAAPTAPSSACGPSEPGAGRRRGGDRGSTDARGRASIAASPAACRGAPTVDGLDGAAPRSDPDRRARAHEGRRTAIPSRPRAGTPTSPAGLPRRSITASAGRASTRTVLGHRTAYLAARRRGGEIVGIFPIVQVKSALFGNLACSMPFVNYGGPGRRDAPTVEQALLERGSARLRRLERRVPRDSQHGAISATRCPVVRAQGQHDARSRRPIPEVLWKDFKTGHRQDIRRGYKNGLTAKFGGVELLDAFYEVHGRELARAGHADLLASSYFDADRPRRFGRRPAHLRVVYAGDEPAAAAFDGIQGDDGRRDVAGHARRSTAISCVGYVLYWELIKNACEAGLHALPSGPVDRRLRRRDRSRRNGTRRSRRSTGTTCCGRARRCRS